MLRSFSSLDLRPAGRRIAGEGAKTRASCMRASHARFGEAGCTLRRRAAAEIEPPGHREADRVESEINHQRELRSAGDRDRLAEATGDQVAAAGADRADEAECGAALDRGGLERGRASGITLASRLLKILLAEYRGDHPIGRTVADAGRDEQDQEHRQEADEVLVPDEVQHADRSGGHRDEVPESDDLAS